MMNALDRLVEFMGGPETPVRYMERHGIDAERISTMDDERARLIADRLADRVCGKVVVEIGAGYGLLACHLGEYAARVFAIEAAPEWALGHLAWLYDNKPRNVSYLFGAAQEFAGYIKGDVAIFCTCSGREQMRQAGTMFAPVVIDVYDEIAPGKPWVTTAELAKALEHPCRP